jgi:hypothetical protein
MKRLYFRKIRQFPRLPWKNENNPKGALTLLSVFLFVIFSTLGIGMLYLTQVYLKTSAFRKNTMLLEYASENGIKMGFDQLYRMLSLATSPVTLSEAEAWQLRNDSLSQGNEAVQRIFGCGLPIGQEENWERFVWTSLMDFQFSGIREAQEYFLVEYGGRISATGKMLGFNPEKTSFLDSKLDVLAGHIPLPAIPFLMDKAMTSDQKRVFLEENEINIIPSEHADLPPSVAFSDGGLLPAQAVRQLAEALKIEIFQPQDLSASALRLALGLEINNEPIPEGVYLIRDDMGLGGVFVQGDLDEMILAIQDNFQIISFLQGQELWILRFSLDERRTIFISPDGIRSYDFVPLGIIIVNGKILSLGAGSEDPTGQIIMAGQAEIPCVLKGVNLTIISSDEVTLSTHLIYQGVSWKEGVPYLKDADSQLVIHATGQDFLSGEARAGQVIIGDNSPEELKIQASLSASGMGIEVQGENRNVQVFGSLQASELTLNGNEINIRFDDRFFHEFGDNFQNAPLTEKPVLYICRFKIMEWREDT